MALRDEPQELGPADAEAAATPRPPLLLTYVEAGYELGGISGRQVRRMVERDQLPGVRIGRLRFVAYDDLRAWVKRQRKFHSYFVTPEIFKLERRRKDEKRLDDEFQWS